MNHLARKILQLLPGLFTCVGSVAMTWLALGNHAAAQVRVQGPPMVTPPAQTIGRPGPGQPYGPQPQPQMPPRTASRQGVPIPPRDQQAPAAPPVPQVPFELTPEQEQELIRLLRAWEARSNKVQTLSCEFVRLDYDPVFGPRDANNQLIAKRSKGEIKYAAPDKGLYHITEMLNFVGMDGKEPKFQATAEGGEHWVCDGKAIWEYNYPKKQLIERQLPPNMQGKAITEGPLPFLFGAQADKLLNRYWMRVVTPPTVKGQAWLEAFPKHQSDAANFQRATVILDSVTLFPQAIEIHLPNGKNRHVHTFHDNVVNQPAIVRFFQGDFAKPALPAGWTKLEDPPRAAAGAAQAPRG